MIIVLDTFPASSMAKQTGKHSTTSDRCREWIYESESQGHHIHVPEIVYYEALRELERRQAPTQIALLKEFCLATHRFLPLMREDIELAARLWGQARRTGRPTADPHALDGDVILAAQAINFFEGGFVVATTNTRHLSQFVTAKLWTDIQP